MEPREKGKPITVEAFRFIQVKTPDLFTGKSMNISFVYHPAVEDSPILNQSIGEDTADDTSNFSMYSSIRALQQLQPTLYEFMFWLKEYRGRLTADLLQTATKKVQPLEQVQELEVWENLLHQTQANNGSKLTEGLIRILQTNHFVKQYQKVEDKNNPDTFPTHTLEQAAKATVVLPDELFQTPDNTTSLSQELDERSRQLLSNQLQIAVHEHHIQTYTKVLTEIAAVEKAYAIEDSTARQQAFLAYQEAVQTWQKNNPHRFNEQGVQITAEEELGVFEYQSAVTWDKTYLQQHLSEQNWNIFQAFSTNLHKTIGDTTQSIKASIADSMKTKVHLLQKNHSQTILHQGIELPSRNRPLHNSYSFELLPLSQQSGLYTIYWTQYHENAATAITKIVAQAQTPEGEDLAESSSLPIHKTTAYSTFQLFPTGIAIAKNTAIQLQGHLETQNSTYSHDFKHQSIYPNTTVAAKNNSNTLQRDIPQPDVFGVMDIKVAEFKKVNQTLCCYVEGEVSHIENILAREYKERATRNLMRSEHTTETTTERETESMTDTTSVDRHEIQAEVALMLQEQQSRNTALSASVGGSYNFGAGGISFNTNGSLNTSSSSSSSSNFNEAEAYAKELTERAMKRLVVKTTNKRTSKIVQEYEENNKHGFDNREGTKHVTGVYRWVDKIYKNELVNYGKRLMYEFVLPEPAKNYKYLLQQNVLTGKTTSCDTIVLQKPLSPQEMGITAPQDITEINYGAIAAYYELELEEGYPIQFQRIAKSFSENFYQAGGARDNDNDPWHVSKSFDFELPEHYICYNFFCQFVSKRHGANNSINGDLLIGDVAITLNNSSTTINNTEYLKYIDGSATVTGSGTSRGAQYTRVIPVNPPSTPAAPPTFTPVEGHLPISLAAEDIGVFAMTVWAECHLNPEILQQWKAKFYQMVHTAYKVKISAYNDAVAEHCARKKQDQAASDNTAVPNYNINPLMARMIERQEIKRIIIEQIIQKAYHIQYGVPYASIGYNNYLHDAPNNNLNVYRNNAFYKEHMKYAKFLEQAFDWEIMAYKFLPYYWADEREWGELLSLDTAADSVFLAFLQAGMVDITLPVKAGLEKSVTFLLETGYLWRGDGFTVSGQDDLYLAISEQMELEVDNNGNEIKYGPKGEVIPVIEASWETRVPSTLTIVQNKSNPLDREGLPCYCEEENSDIIGYSENGRYNLMRGKEDDE